MQKPQNSTVKIRFRRANSRSRVAAPVKIKAIFTNSEGWKLMKPRSTQFFAPKMACPRTTLKISSRQVNTATGQRRETVVLISRRSMLRARKMHRPMSMAMVCLRRVSGE